MRRTTQTLNLSDEDIEAVCSEVLKMKPQWERAVRLRLQRLTCAMIADRMNAESEPGAEPVSTRWVNRRCHRARKVLDRFLTKQDEIMFDRSVPDHELKDVAEVFWKILFDQEHNHEPGIWQNTYPCGQCGDMEWDMKHANVGGNRNVRTYICGRCGAQYSADERSKLIEKKKFFPLPEDWQ